MELRELIKAGDTSRRARPFQAAEVHYLGAFELDPPYWAG